MITKEESKLLSTNIRLIDERTMPFINSLNRHFGSWNDWMTIAICISFMKMGMFLFDQIKSANKTYLSKAEFLNLCELIYDSQVEFIGKDIKN